MLIAKTIRKELEYPDRNSMQDLRILSNASIDVNDANSACASEEQQEVPAWIKQGGIILVFLGMIICFWSLAQVCDHYFCASLLVLCEEKKIPDNVT